MTTLELHLPYFKQGCDLAYFLNDCPTTSQALERDAMMLDSAAEIVYKVFDIVRKYEGIGREIKIDADTHTIIIECDDDIAEELLKLDAISVPDYINEFDDEMLDDSDYIEEDEEE